MQVESELKAAKDKISALTSTIETCKLLNHHAVEVTDVL